MFQCVCLLDIRSIELATYPAPAWGTQFSSESVHDIGIGGRHLAMSLKASVTTLTELCTTSKAQNGNHSCTLLHHWAGLNVTTLPWYLVFLGCVLSLRRSLPYGQMDGWMDGQTDKNLKNIAVTLRLCFAARVNNIQYKLDHRIKYNLTPQWQIQYF